MQVKEAQNIVKDSSIESLNWSDEKARLNIKIESQAIEIEKLKHYVKLLKDAIYGKKSEKLDKEAIKQLGLLFNEAEIYSEEEQEELPIKTTTIKEDKRKPGRKKLPKELPREQIIYDITEEEKRCGCGCQLSSKR